MLLRIFLCILVYIIFIVILYISYERDPIDNEIYIQEHLEKRRVQNISFNKFKYLYELDKNRDIDFEIYEHSFVITKNVTGNEPAIFIVMPLSDHIKYKKYAKQIIRKKEELAIEQEEKQKEDAFKTIINNIEKRNKE